MTCAWWFEAEFSLQALLKYEGPADSLNCFFTVSSISRVYNVFDHLFGIRTGALEM